MDIRVIVKILAGLLIILAILLCVPAFYSYSTDGPHTKTLLQIAAMTFVFGLMLWTVFKDYAQEISHRTGFAVVTFSWVTASLFGSLPYWFTGTTPLFINALFESASGFSGTGASIFLDIEAVDKSVLLWRSMTQWLGGMGIIVFFIAILPILRVGGVQLFRAETTGPQKDKITPRVRETAKNLWLLYIGFTTILAILLRFCGMSGFDAVNHAMTTIATGGFSTRNAGIATYNSATIEYLLCLFMLLGSINFSLHYRFLVLRDKSTLDDTELKGYLTIILATFALLTFYTWGTNFEHFSDAFRASLFTVIVTVSTTGFTNYNYIEWPIATHYIIILLMVMGGMSGSTSGGNKCIRLIAAFKLLLKELKQVVHPHAYLTVKTNDRSVRTEIASAIWGFLFMYLGIFSIVAFILTTGGLDLETAASAAFSALSNIGPALGTIGPYDNYNSLTDVSKVTLSLAMILGRLEFFTLLVLLTPAYWRK